MGSISPEWLALVGIALTVFSGARYVASALTRASLRPVSFVLLPQPLMQSSSTQNDLIEAFFVVATAFFAVRGLRDRARGDMVVAALALGLAVGTKGTAPDRRGGAGRTARGGSRRVPSSRSFRAHVGHGRAGGHIRARFVQLCAQRSTSWIAVRRCSRPRRGSGVLARKTYSSQLEILQTHRASKSTGLID